MRIFTRAVKHRENGWERRVVRDDSKVSAANDKGDKTTFPLKPGVSPEFYIAFLLREGWTEIH